MKNAEKSCKQRKEYIKVCNNFSTQFFNYYLPKGCVYGRTYDIRRPNDNSLSIYYYIDDFRWMSSNKVPEKIAIHVLRGQNKDFKLEYWHTYFINRDGKKVENEQLWDMMLFCVKNVAKGTVCEKCGNQIAKVVPKEKKAQTDFEPIRGRIGWALKGDDWGNSVVKSTEGVSGDWQGDRWRIGSNDPVKPLYKQPVYKQKYEQPHCSNRTVIYEDTEIKKKVREVTYKDRWYDYIDHVLNSHEKSDKIRYIIVGDDIIRQELEYHDSKKMWKNIKRTNIPYSLCGINSFDEMLQLMGTEPKQYIHDIMIHLA